MALAEGQARISVSNIVSSPFLRAPQTDVRRGARPIRAGCRSLTTPGIRSILSALAPYQLARSHLGQALPGMDCA